MNDVTAIDDGWKSWTTRRTGPGSDSSTNSSSVSSSSCNTPLVRAAQGADWERFPIQGRESNGRPPIEQVFCKIGGLRVGRTGVVVLVKNRGGWKRQRATKLTATIRKSQNRAEDRVEFRRFEEREYSIVVVISHITWFRNADQAGTHHVRRIRTCWWSNLFLKGFSTPAALCGR
jgi:hypothetical protein